VRNPRAKIIGDFASWAAMSSARQGPKVRGRRLYRYIDAIQIENLLERSNVSKQDFASWHKRQVKKLARSASSMGWAAKIINMVTKVRIYINREGPKSLRSLIHPPLDSILVKKIKEEIKKLPPAQHQQMLGPFKKLSNNAISRIKTYEEYEDIIKILENLARRKRCSVFEIEKLWDPRANTK